MRPLIVVTDARKLTQYWWDRDEIFADRAASICGFFAKKPESQLSSPFNSILTNTSHMNEKSLVGRLTGFGLCAMMILAGCSEAAAPGDDDDNRPDGTQRVRIVFSHFCDLSAGARAFLYDDLKILGGKLLEEQDVVEGELNYYLPPSTGRYALEVESEGREIYSTTFYSSDRDVQLDSAVCQ